MLLNLSFLQEAADVADDPVNALSRVGLFIPESAVHYLSPCQLECISCELTEMEETFAVEAAAWVLSYRLGRARVVNRRM